MSGKPLIPIPFRMPDTQNKKMIDCSTLLYPKQVPAGTVCRIGSGQKLFSSSDIEVGQSETGPWLLCSVCGQPHDLYGFEGPVWIRATWGATFFTEGPASPSVIPTAIPVSQSYSAVSPIKNLNFHFSRQQVIIGISLVAVLALLLILGRRLLKKYAGN